MIIYSTICCKMYLNCRDCKGGAVHCICRWYPANNKN